KAEGGREIKKRGGLQEGSRQARRQDDQKHRAHVQAHLSVAEVEWLRAARLPPERQRPPLSAGGQSQSADCPARGLCRFGRARRHDIRRALAKARHPGSELRAARLSAQRRGQPPCGDDTGTRRPLRLAVTGIDQEKPASSANCAAEAATRARRTARARALKAAVGGRNPDTVVGRKPRTIPGFLARPAPRQVPPWPCPHVRLDAGRLVAKAADERMLRRAVGAGASEILRAVTNGNMIL